MHPSGQTQPDYVFTANTIAGLAITGSNGNDTITVGNASQTVRTGAGHSTVELTADTAEALVIGGTGTTLLEIAGGGTTALNFNTTKVTVQLDAPTDLTLSAKGAVTALGSSGADAIVAQARAQTLTGGGGADTLIGFAAGSDIFRDTSAGLNGDTIGNFAAKGDIINLTDMNIATIQTLGFSQGPQSATLTVGDGTHTATIALLGQFAQAGFHYAADTTGGGGVDLTYVAPAVQHSAMLGSPV